jgi:hypothetical protein
MDLYILVFPCWPGAAHRIYFEVHGDFYNLGRTSYPTIPMGASYFPKELLLLPPACVLSISFAATKLI